eukprot:CAMPEP_0114641368 /NCGR_PEP_ID=MMETSP0191-20121206/2217_1 /TAXON_ID=126664 /ORGANISM="Sorites sp." /LENGTH=380 /DNA_ID=CAMNT_0001853399 /DNA_START=52 /DNA_END=1194 /DNA_ORIENTATION=-
MAEKDVKLAQLLETIGEGADLDFAREVLIANNWDLQAAATVILGDGAQVAARSAPSAPAVATTPPEGLKHVVSDEVRAPMRTGFCETLLTTDAAEQARQDKAREEERLRLEAERVAAEERKRREAEESHQKNLARIAEEQRAVAERQAVERKKQKAQEEQEALRARKVKKGRRRDDDSDDDLEDIPVESGVMLADLSNQLASKVESSAKREEVKSSMPVSGEASQMRLEEAPQAPEAPQTLPPVTAEETLPPEAPRETEAGHEEKADSFVVAIRVLRKKHREAAPAALATCFRTLNDLIRNVIEHPQEAKYQRIKAEKFRSRVGDLEGAVAVLEASGFYPDDSKEFLVMDPDYARTQGLRLRENKRKVELLLGDLENAGF